MDAEWRSNIYQTVRDIHVETYNTLVKAAVNIKLKTVRQGNILNKDLKIRFKIRRNGIFHR